MLADLLKKGASMKDTESDLACISWVIPQPAMLMSISTSRPFDTGKGFFR